MENREDAVFCKSCGGNLKFETIDTKEQEQFEKQIKDIMELMEKSIQKLSVLYYKNLEQQQKKYAESKQLQRKELDQYAKEVNDLRDENQILKEKCKTISEENQRLSEKVSELHIDNKLVNIYEAKPIEQSIPVKMCCPKCGTLYDEESMFCEECGAKLS